MNTISSPDTIIIAGERIFCLFGFEIYITSLMKQINRTALSCSGIEYSFASWAGRAFMQVRGQTFCS